MLSPSCRGTQFNRIKSHVEFLSEQPIMMLPAKCFTSRTQMARSVVCCGGHSEGWMRSDFCTQQGKTGKISQDRQNFSDENTAPRGWMRRRFSLYVCVFSSHPFWTSSSLDVPAGVTQEEGHTGFLIHLPSAVRALIFVARRIQPFLSLVDREVEFCVLTN